MAGSLCSACFQYYRTGEVHKCGPEPGRDEPTGGAQGDTVAAVSAQKGPAPDPGLDPGLPFSPASALGPGPRYSPASALGPGPPLAPASAPVSGVFPALPGPGEPPGPAGLPSPAVRGSGVAALLPVALRTGRLDPGRRGAAALVVAALLAAVVAGGVLLRGRPQEVLAPQVLSSGSPVPGTSPEPAGAPGGPGGEVVVSVAGKVVRPGLVRLPAGSRVDDAVRAAGGPAPGASAGLLNLARRLVDGEQVLVGVEPAAGAPATAGAGSAAPGGLLDLNTATVADLDALPGIGPVLAQRILDWRTEHERFASVDQLREVTGIGEAKYDDLRGEVTV